MNTDRVIQIFGWYGMAAIVVAYALTSFSLLGSDTLAYQLLNLSGASGLAIVSFRKKAYQPGFLNLVWIGIAVLALLRMVF